MIRVSRAHVLLLVILAALGGFGFGFLVGTPAEPQISISNLGEP